LQVQDLLAALAGQRRRRPNKAVVAVQVDIQQLAALAAHMVLMELLLPAVAVVEVAVALLVQILVAAAAEVSDFLENAVTARAVSIRPRHQVQVQAEVVELLADMLTLISLVAAPEVLVDYLAVAVAGHMYPVIMQPLAVVAVLLMQIIYQSHPGHPIQWLSVLAAQSLTMLAVTEEFA